RGAHPPMPTARQWAAEMRELERQRQDDITARRLATLARNAPHRPPRIRRDDPVGFFVSPRVRREWFPSERQYQQACYFLDLIHLHRVLRWKWLGEKFVRLKVRYLLRVIPQKDWLPLKQLLLRRGVIECDDKAVK